ncbi:hypothetical protein QOT17_017153 [Balamuthia mandrillaris]
MKTLLLLFASLLFVVVCVAAAEVAFGVDDAVAARQADSEVGQGRCEQIGSILPYCSSLQFYYDNPWVYLPPNTTAKELQQSMSGILNALLGLTELDSQCSAIFLKAFCATWARPCVVIDGEPHHYPVQPCQSLCHQAVEGCTAATAILKIPIGLGLYFPNGGRAPVSCLEEETIANETYSFYPVNGTIYPIASNDSSPSSTYFAQCNANQEVADSICVEPLYKTGSGCGFECPLPSLDEEDYDAVKVLQLVIGWFSFVGSIVLAVTYILSPKLRVFPSNLILMTTLAASIAAFAIILPTFATYDQVWCGVDGTYLVPEVSFYNGGYEARVEYQTDSLIAKSGLCTFQGFVLHWGFLSSTFWWCLISFNMFFTLFFKPPQIAHFEMYQQIAYQLVGWCVPFILAVIPAAADRVGFASSDSFCFVTIEDGGAWFLTFWVVPVGLLLAIGLTLFLCSIVRIFYVAKQSDMLRKTWVTYYRLVTFILIFLLIYLSIFLYSIFTLSNESEIEEAYTEYFSCLSFLDLEELRENGGCFLDSSATYFPLVILRALGFSLLGFLLFINFFFSQMVFNFWRQTAQALMRGDMPSIFSSSKSSHSGSKKKADKQNIKMTLGEATSRAESIFGVEEAEDESSDESSASNGGGSEISA